MNGRAFPFGKNHSVLGVVEVAEMTLRFVLTAGKRMVVLTRAKRARLDGFRRATKRWVVKNVLLDTHKTRLHSPHASTVPQVGTQKMSFHWTAKTAQLDFPKV
jgi:hypothetical protein